MTDMLIQEINDDVRRDRMIALFNAVKKPLLISAALLIAVTAGVSINKHYDQQAKAEATTVLLEGAELYGRKDYAGAEPLFAQAAEKADGELKGIAQLWQARSSLGSGDTEKATDMLTTLTNGDASRIRDMACIQLYSLNADVPANCTGKTASPMHATLALLNAATQWQAGKTDDAITALTALSADASLAEEERDLAKRYLTTIQASQTQHAH